MVRFHLSLNVADLTKSVEFYRALFGMEPAKQRADYAKFEPDEPPLVLSLEPNQGPKGGTLNHLGFRLPDAETLVALQARLEAAGLKSEREEGVECCYAKQTKFWLHDPDGTMWELYTLDGDLEHRGHGQSQAIVMASAGCCAAVEESVVYEHRMGSPLPESIPMGDASADEVRLRGTLNAPMTTDIERTVLHEAWRVLKPGGRLFVHVLTGDQAMDNPELPGAASGVRRVPAKDNTMKAIEEAGFTGLNLLKYGTTPCFTRGNIAMRETQVEARRV